MGLDRLLTFVQGSADWLQNLLPVERWVRSLDNSIKSLGLSFVVLAILLGAVLGKDWGFTSSERVILAIVLMFLLLCNMGSVLVLTLVPGDRGYNPYQRSLRAGKNYGTRESSRSRDQMLSEPAELPAPELLPPGEQQNAGLLT